MKEFIKAIVASIFLLIISPVRANIIDFISMTEMAGGYGEGAWSTLPVTSGTTSLWITGHSGTDDDNAQFAYLDWGKAGLGVCKDVIAPGMVDVAHPGNKANNCNPGNDDNTTRGEYLQFVFNKRVVVQNIWFNNNHDGGFVAGDKVSIAGNPYNVATGYAGGVNGIGTFAVNAFSPLSVGYYNKQFYVSAIEFAEVAEPSSSIIFALGLISLFYVRRQKW